MDFFRLTNRQSEDKVVSKKSRIYDDAITFGKDNSFLLETTSNAPKQKIKFFLDVIHVRKYLDEYDPEAMVDPDTGVDPNEGLYEDNWYRIGRWYELEHLEQVQLNNTSGWYSFSYSITRTNQTNEKDSYIFSFPFEDRGSNQPGGVDFWLYISSVSFSDSYYNPNNGWLADGNPAAILDEETGETIKDRIVLEINQTLPDGAETDDFLVQGENGPEWKNGEEVTEFLSLVTESVPGDDTQDPPLEEVPAKQGVVIVDEKTIRAVDGVISVPLDNDTLILDTDELSPSFGKIRSTVVSGGGIEYSTQEIDTGDLWINGKKVFVRVATNLPSRASNYNVFPDATANVEDFIDKSLTIKDSTRQIIPYSVIPANYAADVCLLNNRFIFNDTSGANVGLYICRVFYTKIDENLPM